MTTLARLHPLDRVPRSGWLLRGVTEPESVASHSHALALLTLLACDAWPGSCDAGRAIAMALVHDCAEVVTMDIPMPAGDAGFRDSKSRTELAAIESLFDGLPSRSAELFKEFERAETPEAKLVRGLDKVQMMIRAACYQREGRGTLEDFWTHGRNFEDYGIEAVRELFAEVARFAGRKLPRIARRRARASG
ncbi:MAG: HD domain-containing protein [Spirochaetes bacterium]|nr:HD domain-containing protein [Spirochaetota bacterium]